MKSKDDGKGWAMRVVTTEEMRRLDRRAIRDFGIPSLLLMENAGLSVAREVLRFLKIPESGRPGQAADGRSVAPPRAVGSGRSDQAADGGSTESVRAFVFCGKGNNGGDGLVAARHLTNRGVAVELLLLARESELKEDPAVNFKIVLQMGIPIYVATEHPPWDFIRERLRGCDAIIDALLGIGTTSEVREPLRQAIEIMNESKAPVVAVDCPSGLNSDTGEVMGCAVRADLTVTLALPKKGFYTGEGPKLCGEISVADISIPRELLEATEGVPS